MNNFYETPPSWSLAVGGLGRTLIVAAAALFIVSVLAWLFAPRKKVLETIGKWSFGLAAVSLLGTFLCLASLFVANRFEWEYVWGHADSKNAVPYRIAGIWSGQQGSFLLWACAAAVFGLLTARLTRHYRRWFTIAYGVFLGALASILAFESPYHLTMVDGRPVVPPDGAGLAPSLQNYWVTIHPPTIFLGFGSLTVLFALAFAAIMTRDYEEWIPIVRPWSIVSLTLVGVGLCMGGFWAYETLGWGGFWMWDPVENVSFVPWCFAVAFTHGVIVQATRKKWQISNLLLGGMPFLVFLYGTFLTRSGMLADASVHSFAEMNRSALKLLIGVLVLALLGFGGMWTFRVFQAKNQVEADELKTKGLRREGFYRLGNIFLVLMGLATMVGMSVPFIMALKGVPPKVVEEGLYHQVLPWIFIPLMLFMAIAPFASWRSMPAKEFFAKIYSVACVAVGLTGLTVFLAVITPYGKQLDLAPTITLLGRQTKGLPWLLFLVGLCYFALVGNLWRMAELGKRTKLGLSPFLAHVGVAVLLAGLIISRGFEQFGRTMVMKDHPGRVLGYEFRLKGMTSTMTDRNNAVQFEVFDANAKEGAKPRFVASPGLYNVVMGDGQKNVMVWPYIERGALKDVYISMRPPEEQASEIFSLAPGKTIMFGNYALTSEGMTRVGEVGQPGTKFGAKIRIRGPKVDKVVNPQMQLGGEAGMKELPVQIDDDMVLAMTGMNAADKSAALQVRMTAPMYTLEVFHKPMTILVLLGTALMTIAGIAAAVYRRPRNVKASSGDATKEEKETSRELTHVA